MIFKQRLFIFLIILILCSPLSAFSSRKKVKVVKEEEMQIEEPSENTDDLNITDETVQEVIIEPSTESYTKKTQPQKTKTTQKTQRTLTEQEKQEEKERQEKLAKQMELALEKEKKKSAAAKNQKEYLSDYMLSEIDTIDQNNENPYDNINDPNETDAMGVTLLMKAARLGNEWQVKRLLESGADSSLKDKDGWTALMYAVRYNEGLECVEMLLKSKADVKLTNNYGLSALALAASYNNNPKILSSLLKNYKASDKDVLRALTLLLSEQNTPEDVLLSKLQIILDTALPVNILYEGKTPLMYAAAYGKSTKAIQMLLDYNASVTLRSTEGKTAFDYATKNKNLAHDDSYWALNVK